MISRRRFGIVAFLLESKAICAAYFGIYRPLLDITVCLHGREPAITGAVAR